MSMDDDAVVKEVANRIDADEEGGVSYRDPKYMVTYLQLLPCSNKNLLSLYIFVSKG